MIARDEFDALVAEVASLIRKVDHLQRKIDHLEQLAVSAVDVASGPPTEGILQGIFDNFSERLRTMAKEPRT